LEEVERVSRVVVVNRTLKKTIKRKGELFFLLRSIVLPFTSPAAAATLVSLSVSGRFLAREAVKRVRIE